MASSRRQQRVARVIKEVVSEGIIHHISDPRLTAVVSVTEIEITPDLRKADIYLSFVAKDDSEKNRTMDAIKHARGRLQTMVAKELDIRFCPIIEFHENIKIKKTSETLKLIDQVTKEFTESPVPRHEEDEQE